MILYTHTKMSHPYMVKQVLLEEAVPDLLVILDTHTKMSHLSRSVLYDARRRLA
jgi:hypothetical protein